jgi:hypothetical protein
LSEGDDRAKAIVAAAYIENNLAMAILARFRLLNDAGQKHLYDSEHSALATFSAKIDIGWALNLYDAAVREDLHRIRKIRNKFAHELHVRTFDDPEVRGYCDGLVGIKYLEPLKRRTKPRSRAECYIDLAAHFGERFALDSNSHKRPSPSLNRITPEY